ncbi:KAP family NTPase [Loktanella sp. F6476L]|uniref:P-loop NTPase fold protein n=1 Tax=Loktanella sp. F6476L TaxID=2926405 RepID=UPI001FF65AB5|nr:P-loop NTPase fold protein [Loktanella sp. F6476L]MCK0120974.1 KAP family NTPase [Loktanella sp. F6476L]
MSINTPVAEAINAYLARKAPGFALLMDAPWGAGKTHFIRSVTKCDTNHRVHYVTLNGVDAPTAFRRALLASMPASKLAKSTGTLGKALSDLAGIGDLGGFAQNAIEDHAIATLPNAIIFDDLERCTMEVPVLLGLLNEFVEHQDKNIILIANIDEYPDKDLFLSRQEKVVGRTVRLKAEAGSVLGVFVNALPDGAGKDWMTENKDVVLQVFHDSKSNNLRILRQVVHDCAAVLDQIDDDLMAAKHAVERFIVTYMALAIALIGHEISAEDIQERGDFTTFRSGKGDEPTKMWVVSERHRHSELFAGNSANILPVGLGEMLLVHGYATAVDLNFQLRLTGQFKAEDTNPLWQRAVLWRDCGHQELTDLIQDMRVYLLKTDEVVPAHYLHIADNFLQLTDAGATQFTADMALENITGRISEIADAGGFVAPKSRGDYGWSSERGFSYGGYLSSPTPAFATVMETVKAAQDKAFEASLPTHAAHLQQIFEEDHERFRLHFAYNGQGANFYDTSVLHLMDADAFATAIFALIRNGRSEALGETVEVVVKRYGPDTDWSEELLWAAAVEERLLALAEAEDGVAVALVGLFITRYWKFPSVEGTAT